MQLQEDHALISPRIDRDFRYYRLRARSTRDRRRKKKKSTRREFHEEECLNHGRVFVPSSDYITKGDYLRCAYPNGGGGKCGESDINPFDVRYYEFEILLNATGNSRIGNYLPSPLEP